MNMTVIAQLEGFFLRMLVLETLYNKCLRWSLCPSKLPVWVLMGLSFQGTEKGVLAI